MRSYGHIILRINKELTEHKSETKCPRCKFKIKMRKEG
jgi:DNA-directed RNA polymerase subunit RPC12/RpoP